MKIQDAAETLKNLITANADFAGIPVFENNYGTELVNQDAAEAIADKGIAIVVYTFGAMSKGASFPTQVTCSIVENPQQRASYIDALGSDPEAGDTLRTLQIVQLLMSQIEKGKKFQCGRQPITLAQPQPCERILSESGRLQFDVRTLVPAQAN